MQHPTLPPILGGYRLVAELSRGRSGYVYEARKVPTDQRVVIKLFPVSYALDLDAAKRFETEITILKQLNHSGIPAPLDQGTDQGFSYFVLPWIHGCTLRDLCRLDPIEPQLGARLIRDAAMAIGHAHDHGVIHRDIKAENLMLDQDSKIHVLDFGISHLASQHGSTQAGDLLGTPYAMSPEQASGNSHSIDIRSDIYSLGVVLFYLLTTQEPIRGSSPQDLLSQIPRASIRPPRRINANVPRALDTICMRCLEKNRNHRYASSVELVDDLDRFMTGRPILSRRKSVWRSGIEFCQFNPLAALLIASLGLIAISLLWVLFDFRNDAIQEHQYTRRLEAYTQQVTRQAEQERQLKEQADRLKAIAIDNETKANEENIQGILQRAESHLRAKDLLASKEDLTGLASRPKMWSIDCEWAQRRTGSTGYEQVIISLATTDRALYDSCISPDGAWLATVDRCGDIAVWNLATQQLLHRFTDVPLDPHRLIPFTRWHYLFDQDRGISLPKPPLFFSSVDWIDSQRFLVGGCDGTLYEATLDSQTLLPVYSQEEAIQYVRLDADREHILVASANGLLRQLDRQWKVIGEYSGSSASSLLQFLPECQTWCLADQTGKLTFLTRDLQLQYEHSFAGKIHDIECIAFEDSLRLLVVEHHQPIREFRLEVTPTFRLEFVRELPTPASQTDPTLEQIALVPSGGILVAMDQTGSETHWSYPSGELVGNYARLARFDRRPPSDQERESSDALEARTRWKLEVYRDRLAIIDCIGTFSTIESHRVPSDSPWRQLSLQVGAQAFIAMDAKKSSLGWALNQDGELSVFDVLQDRILAKRLEAYSEHTPVLQLLPSGDAVTAGHGQSIKRWRFTGSEIEWVEEYEHRHRLLSVAAHEGKGLLASVSAEAELVVWKWGSKQPIHVIDLIPLQPDITAEMARRNILTGRLAFSPDGDFLACSGPIQLFEVFQTSDFTRRPIKHRHIAGRGCVDVCFSPMGNDRFLCSDTLGPSGNYVLVADQVAANINSSLGPQIPIQQILASRDGKRMLTLAKHEIAFFTSQHFVKTFAIPPPTRTPCSFALAASDAAILVNDAHGSVFVASIDADVPKGDELQCEGQFSWILSPEERRQILPVGSQTVSSESISGTPPRLALAIQAAEETPPKLHLLEWEGDWKIREARIPSLEGKNLDWINLHRNPAGNLHLLIRYKPVDGVGFEGGILSAIEKPRGSWEVESIQNGGNSGFSAVPTYDAAGKLQSILHFDYNGQKLVQSTRGAAGDDWPWHGIRGSTGWALSGVRLRNGNQSYLMRRSRGFDAFPVQYAERDQEGRFHFENAEGPVLLATKDERLYSWNPYTQKLYHRVAPGNWTHVPFPTGEGDWPYPPFLDHRDRLWFAKIHANDALVRMIDLGPSNSPKSGVKSKGQQLRIPLERNFPESPFLMVATTDQGTVELIAVTTGEESSILRITTPNPFD